MEGCPHTGEPVRLCHKRAVCFGPKCAKVRFFSTSSECFRAGWVMGKSLKRMVSAEGIEPSTYCLRDNQQYRIPRTQKSHGSEDLVN